MGSYYADSGALFLRMTNLPKNGIKLLLDDNKYVQLPEKSNEGKRTAVQEGCSKMESDILTIKEISDYLRIKEKTAYYLASEGEIPGFKVGGSWRFKKSEIEKWVKQKSNKLGMK